MPSSSVLLNNSPAEDAKDQRGRPMRMSTISDLGYDEGKLLVSGLSNHEFSSSFKSIPYPFTSKQDESTLEIYHGAHGKYETSAPIKTFTTATINNKKFLVGHGDGLGPGDKTYKILKKVFNSRVCQWLFARIHPNAGIGIANYWSRSSRISNTKKEEKFQGEEGEYLLVYCREMEKETHHDYYVFGHRHLPLDIKINERSRYVNLGEWVNFSTYAEYDGRMLSLKSFEPKPAP